MWFFLYFILIPSCAFILFVQENETLWTLNLSWNGLGKEGCIELAQSLKKNTRLTDLNVLSNRIDMTSLRFLLHGLVQNKGLRYIQVNVKYFAFVH